MRELYTPSPDDLHHLGDTCTGVTEEDHKALLGHKNGSITNHYSGAELGHLIEAANMAQ
ncbi:Prophage integrase [Pseudomonas sp. R11-23-07]|nr:Prophage integrase [Pseudomonas sp. R2-7-07]AZF59702.1 Prophage integrase [Pseudomonas sp. R11-23-07]